MHLTIRAAVATVALLGALTAAGCGDSDDAAAGPAPSVTFTEPTPAATTPAPAQPTTTAVTPVQTTTTDDETSPVACGIDINSAEVNNAFASLSEAFPGVGWVAERATDECNTLAWVQATVEGATGSSPNHVLFFVDRQFLGTATAEPYAFSYVESETDDTVTVRYRWLNEGDPTANPTGGPVHVRYQWDGTEVVMLDPLPPEVTG